MMSLAQIVLFVCASIPTGWAEPQAPGAKSKNAAPVSGWTDFKPSQDARTVYVSPRGSDKHDGSSASKPKLTLKAAIEQLRHGHPDRLLLERGGEWRENLGQWKKSGRSASEPMLISSYGDAAERPMLDTGSSSGIWTHGGGGSPATIDHLALVGLHFQAGEQRDGEDCIGARFLQPGTNLLIEDCSFDGYRCNLVFQGHGGRHKNFRLRRSVIADAYAVHATSGHSQGLYAYAVDGLLIEENLFDHNGWNESVPGAGADIYSHNLYIDNDNTDVVVQRNIIANASSHGMQLRCGGKALDNLFVGNSIALSVGGGNNPEPGGVRAQVLGNVILDGKNIDPANPRGWGLWFANIAEGRVARNLIANNTRGTQPVALVLEGRHKGDSVESIGVHKLVIEKNIFFDWGGSIQVKGSPTLFSDVEFVDNDVQDWSGNQPLVVLDDGASATSVSAERNRFFSKRSSVGARLGKRTSPQARADYPDTKRCLASYGKKTGCGESCEEFLKLSRAQSRSNWRTEFTAAEVNRYLREGFELKVQ